MRAFKQLSTNRWLARLDNLSPPPAAPAHIAGVAAEYNIPSVDIQLVESASDPRDLGNLVLPPPHVQTQDEQDRDALRSFSGVGSPTAAQVRDALQRLIQQLDKRGIL